jgi:DNA-binding transcriptional LysR family regulator
MSIGPPSYTLKQIRYFVTVARFENVSRAAEALNISQPSISTAIAQLEAELGVGLFVRHHARGLSLTPAGRRFLRAANRLMAEADALDQFKSELSSEVAGELDIGCILTLAPLLIPPSVAEFNKRYPDARINCHELDHGLMVERILEGTLELAIMYDLGIPDSFDFSVLSHYPPYALVAAGHPLERRGYARLEELAAEPMILLDLPHTSDYFQAIFRDLGIEPNIRYRTASPHMARSLVGNGLGYSLFNAPLKNDRSLDGKLLRPITLVDSLPPLTLGVAMHRAALPTRLADTFRRFILHSHSGLLRQAEPEAPWPGRAAPTPSRG